MIPSTRPICIARRFKKFHNLRFETSTGLIPRHLCFSRTSIFSNSKSQFHSTCNYNTKKEQPFHADCDNLPSSKTTHSKSTELPRPEYELTFTCKPCGARSTHRISKQGYHFGSVLAACPSCKNRHIISDHLKIFGDKRVTVEDLLKEQGHYIKKGTLSENGALEIWDDGSSNKRTEK
ncbi:Mitochondrial protein import protein ZIM17 [Erysiphe neolycopersici]|uniref:Mitochondrial protein import protein ZIM17 n=1 Tax=Erysiphe neolycopersici TaxID=212602 RepID=A0A420HKB9_9PEZI|nr:Mitochondrial protein import protein ZIM17 [Erysiphe neolycopersici]